ncbi:MAG: hypothetical protein ACI84C_000823 [Flavobacteriales bacterium]|jgi:hypothetical protein
MCEEWKMAMQSGIPNLMFIDESVAIDQEIIAHENVFIFDRYSPQKTIQKLKQRMVAIGRLKTASESSLECVLEETASIIVFGLLSKEQSRWKQCEQWLLMDTYISGTKWMFLVGNCCALKRC